MLPHTACLYLPPQETAAALIAASERARPEVSCPSKAKAVDLQKDLHGSAFHQGLNELQEVSGDDREGILHEELQVSHNLYVVGHS